jgi:hypothetical protein
MLRKGAGQLSLSGARDEEKRRGGEERRPTSSLETVEFVSPHSTNRQTITMMMHDIED